MTLKKLADEKLTKKYAALLNQVFIVIWRKEAVDLLLKTAKLQTN